MKYEDGAHGIMDKHSPYRLSCEGLAPGVLPLANPQPLPLLCGHVLSGAKGHGQQEAIRAEASSGRVQLWNGGSVILHMDGGMEEGGRG